MAGWALLAESILKTFEPACIHSTIYRLMVGQLQVGLPRRGTTYDADIFFPSLKALTGSNFSKVIEETMRLLTVHPF